MRLSDVRGDRTLEVVADLIGPVASIAADERTMALLRRERLPEGQSPRQFLLRRAAGAVPALLREHRGDVIAILAAVAGQTPEEYADALDLVRLTRDLTELLTDQAFGQLFISAQTGTEGGSSGSAPESTGDRGA